MLHFWVGFESFFPKAARSLAQERSNRDGVVSSRDTLPSCWRGHFPAAPDSPRLVTHPNARQSSRPVSGVIIWVSIHQVFHLQGSLPEGLPVGPDRVISMMGSSKWQAHTQCAASNPPIFSPKITSHVPCYPQVVAFSQATVRFTRYHSALPGHDPVSGPRP
jgi:hypothetical protein